jgi:hypothetical protein
MTSAGRTSLAGLSRRRYSLSAELTTGIAGRRARVGAETGQLSALSPYEAPDSVFAALDADRWGSESRWRRISITPMTTDREKLLSPL